MNEKSPNIIEQQLRKQRVFIFTYNSEADCEVKSP